MEEVKNSSGLECYLNKPIKRLYNIMAPGTFFKSAGWQDYVKNKAPRQAIILGQNREDYKTYCPCCPR